MGVFDNNPSLGENDDGKPVGARGREQELGQSQWEANFNGKGFRGGALGPEEASP